MRLTLLLILIVPVAFAQPPLWQQYLSDAFRLEKGNRFKEAKAVDLLDLKEEETPVDGGFRRAVTLNNLSLVNRNLGLHSEARELETRIAKLASTTPGKLLGLAVDVEGPLSTDPGSDLPSGSSWKALSAKGNWLREQGRCREAVPLLLRARSGAREELGPNDVSTAIATNNVATAYLCLGELTRAEPYYREALALLGAGESSGMKAGILNNLGIVLLRLKRPQDAEPLLAEALKINQAINGAGHPATATAINTMGYLRMHAGEYAQARRLFQQALAIWQTSLGDSVDTATALDNAGVASLYLGDNEQAKEMMARALELRRRFLPPHHPDIALSLYNYGAALERVGQRKQARKAFREAEASRSAFASENRLGLTVDIRALEKR